MLNFKTCPVCGADITPDMIEAKMCLSCGAEISTEVSTLTEQEIQELAAKEAEAEAARAQKAQKKQDILSASRLRLEESRRNSKYQYLQINDVYEYDVVSLLDTDSGAADIGTIKAVINNRAHEGWRLVNVTTNRIGTNSSSSGFGGMSTRTNAAIDQTLLFFERCVQRYNYDPEHI